MVRGYVCMCVVTPNSGCKNNNGTKIPPVVLKPGLGRRFYPLLTWGCMVCGYVGMHVARCACGVTVMYRRVLYLHQADRFELE